VTGLLDRLLTVHGPLLYVLVAAVVFVEDALLISTRATDRTREGRSPTGFRPAMRSMARREEVQMARVGREAACRATCCPLRERARRVRRFLSRTSEDHGS
jgi:hypothetical protein